MEQLGFFSKPTALFSVPFGYHMIFIAVSVIALVLGFIANKKIYKITMLAGILSTLLVYVVAPGTQFYILCIWEIILFLITVVLMIKNVIEEDKALKAKKNAEVKKEESMEENTDEKDSNS